MYKVCNHLIPFIITNYKVIVATSKLIEVISLHDLHAQLFDNSTEWCAANYDLFGFINWRNQFRALGDTERVVHEIVALEFLTMSWQVIRTDYWIGGTFSNLGKPFRWPFLRLFPSLYSPHPSVGIFICLSTKNANVLNVWSHRYIPIRKSRLVTSIKSPSPLSDVPAILFYNTRLIELNKKKDFRLGYAKL